jgi:hypothetical protein
MPTRKCLGTNKTTFQSILGVSISVRKYRQKIRNGGPNDQVTDVFVFFGDFGDLGAKKKSQHSEPIRVGR